MKSTTNLAQRAAGCATRLRRWCSGTISSDLGEVLCSKLFDFLRALHPLPSDSVHRRNNMEQTHDRTNKRPHQPRATEATERLVPKTYYIYISTGTPPKCLGRVFATQRGELQRYVPWVGRGLCSYIQRLFQGRSLSANKGECEPPSRCWRVLVHLPDVIQFMVLPSHSRQRLRLNVLRGVVLRWSREFGIDDPLSSGLHICGTPLRRDFGFRDLLGIPGDFDISQISGSGIDFCGG